MIEHIFLGLFDLIMTGKQKVIFYSGLAHKNIQRSGTSATMLRLFCVCVGGSTLTYLIKNKVKTENPVTVIECIPVLTRPLFKRQKA